ncbi:MAG TPA: XrtA system polysaccharide deacetylase [Vicinamibacterales bacterium]|nr:XrtA system polysaccharide deacetylase [Vicinamibacterales bacterium]
MIRCLLSVDVEDWFHVENLRPKVTRASWETRERRVVANTRRILDLLAEHDVHATFFVLGWVADREPALVREIAARGHEVASHGYGHELIYAQSADDFKEDIRRARGTLESLTGRPVLGYRAPNFSITGGALAILKEEGYVYDASFFPSCFHDRYGKLDRGQGEPPPIEEVIPGFQEVRISTLRVAGRELPWGGGAYFRVIPYWPFRAGVRRILGRTGCYLFYVHPWEIDADQPRVHGLPMRYRLRHYTGLSTVYDRLAQLLHDFRFTSIAEALVSTESLV